MFCSSIRIIWSNCNVEVLNMREIKFRAWNGVKMCDSLLVARPQFADVLSIMTDEKFAQETYQEKEWKVMQYTGLKDKDSKQIFEGDIVRTGKTDWKGNSTDYPERIGEIMFNENHARWSIKFGDKNYGMYPFVLTVIGNIYENVSLLDGEGSV